MQILSCLQDWVIAYDSSYLNTIKKYWWQRFLNSYDSNSQKHYRIIIGGCLDIFSRSWKPKFVLSLCSIYAVTETIPSLCVPAHAHTAKLLEKALSELKSSHQTRQSQDWACIYAHGEGGGACFLMEFANRFRLTRSDHNFHLETIFSNMSHILKNRFRCLELVQNSCKKCSVQMKKISLQCLLLSTFLTE